MIAITWHRWDGFEDVTDRVFDISWSESVSAPWETISCAATIAPDIGDWLQVGSVFGRVISVSLQDTTIGSGARSVPRYRITCESWFSALDRIRLILAPSAAKWASEGASDQILDANSWGAFLGAWIRGMKPIQGITFPELPGEIGETFNEISTPIDDVTPGGMLKRIWPVLCLLRLPPSVGFGGASGNLSGIQILTRDLDTDGPRRGMLPEVYGQSISAFQNARPGSSIGQMLRGAFAAEPFLVEFFPSRGSLIFRFKPLQIAPINKKSAAEVFGRVGTIGGQTKRVYLETISETIGRFQEGVSPPLQVLEDVYSVSLSRSADDGINAVHLTGPLRSQVETFGVLYAPVMDPDDVARNGLNLWEPSYPFLPRALEGSALGQELGSLAEYAFSVGALGHLTLSGSAEIKFNPDLLPGSWVSLQFRDGWLSAYVEGVSHSGRATERGGRSFRSTISFRRGIVSTKPGIYPVCVPARYKLVTARSVP